MMALIQLNNLQNSVFLKISLLKLLTRSHLTQISNDSKFHLGICASIVKGLANSIYLHREVLNCAQNTYVTRVTNNLNLKADRTNKILKILSVGSIFMMPPTLLSGIFGMNVWYPYRIEDGETIDGFSTIISAMIFISIIQYFLFRYYSLL